MTATRPDLWVMSRYIQWFECFTGYSHTRRHPNKLDLDGHHYWMMSYDGKTRDGDDIQPVPESMQAIPVGEMSEGANKRLYDAYVEKHGEPI